MDPNALAQARAELIKIAHRGYHRGLTAGTGGNISLTVPGTENIVINASGTSWIDAGERELLAVDLDGKVVDGEGIPSKETKWHCGLYRLREEVGAVVHSHSPAATAFSVVGQDIDLVSVTAWKGLRQVPALGFAMPGSDELAEIVLEGFARSPEIKAALIQNHGVVTVGVDVYQAMYFAEVVEDTAKMALYARMLGTPLTWDKG